MIIANKNGHTFFNFEHLQDFFLYPLSSFYGKIFLEFMPHKSELLGYLEYSN